MISKEHLQLFRDAAEAGDAFHANTVKALIRHIDKLQEDYAAKCLALKAANAMQQAKTERSDANELDAERYRYIRTKERMMLETEDGEARMTTTFECAGQFDAAVDEAMQFDADRSAAAKIVSKVPSAAKQLDLDALAKIGDLPCGAACDTIQPLSTKE